LLQLIFFFEINSFDYQLLMCFIENALAPYGFFCPLLVKGD